MNSNVSYKLLFYEQLYLKYTDLILSYVMLSYLTLNNNDTNFKFTKIITLVLFSNDIIIFHH